VIADWCYTLSQRQSNLTLRAAIVLINRTNISSFITSLDFTSSLSEVVYDVIRTCLRRDHHEHFWRTWGWLFYAAVSSLIVKTIGGASASATHDQHLYHVHFPSYMEYGDGEIDP